MQCAETSRQVHKKPDNTEESQQEVKLNPSLQQANHTTTAKVLSCNKQSLHYPHVSTSSRAGIKRMTPKLHNDLT